MSLHRRDRSGKPQMRNSCNVARLVVVHAGVVVAIPAIAAFLFLCFMEDPRNVMHFGGVLAFGFAILFSCIFYGAKTLVFVFLTSPVFLGLSRIKPVTAALGAGAIAGGALGWIVGITITAEEEQAFMHAARLAAAIAGTHAGLTLTFAWREYLPTEERRKACQSV